MRYKTWIKEESIKNFCGKEHEKISRKRKFIVTSTETKSMLNPVQSNVSTSGRYLMSRNLETDSQLNNENGFRDTCGHFVTTVWPLGCFKLTISNEKFLPDFKFSPSHFTEGTGRVEISDLLSLCVHYFY